MNTIVTVLIICDVVGVVLCVVLWQACKRGWFPFDSDQEDS